MLTGNVTVAAGYELTIEGGATVLVDGDYLLLVLGGLSVEGTQAAPVTFTANGTVARWTGIELRGSVLPSSISNTSVTKTLVGIRVNAPAAPVALLDIESSVAAQGAIVVENTAGNFSATNVAVSRSAEGLRLYQTQNVSFLGLRAENMSSFALSLDGSGITFANATILDSAGGVWGRCSCTFDNVSLSNTTTGFALSAMGSGSGPATLKNVQVAGASHPFVPGPFAGTGDAHDIDMRLNVTVDGTPVVTAYKVTDPAPVTGGPVPFLYIYGSSGVDARDLTFVSGVSGVRVIIANTTNSSLSNASFAGRYGLSVYFAANVTFANVSARGTEAALYVNGSDRLRFEDSSFNTSTGSTRTTDRMTNATWTRVTFTGGPLSDVGGADNTYESSDFHAGIWVFGGARMTVRDTRVCYESPAVGLVWDDVRVGRVQNITGCFDQPAILLMNVSDVVVSNNTIFAASHAIQLVQGVRVHIRWNEIRNSTEVAIAVLSGAGSANFIYENELYNNTLQARDEAATGGVQWWNQTTRRGNFWDNYTGLDGNGDIVGDTPVDIGPLTRQDRYPLMAPWDTVPPVAHLWIGTDVDEDVPFLFDASNSTDNRGFVRAEWKITLNRQILRTTGLVTNYSFLDPGLATIELTVFDRWNLSATITANVTVWDVTPPEVNVTSSMVVAEDMDLVINASVFDNDPRFPTGVAFTWLFVGGWRDEVALFNTTTKVASFVFAVPGTYAANLTVSDTAGNAASVNFTVVVLDTTAPTGDFRAVHGDPVTERDRVELALDNVTDEDPTFVATAAIVWNATGPGGFKANATNLSIAFVAPLPGFYTVTYSVVDNATPKNVRAGTYQFVAVDGFAPEWAAPPLIVATDRAPVNLSALAAFDPSGIVSVAWSEGGTVFATGAWVAVPFPVPGDHVVVAELKDPYGHSANFTVVVRIVDTTAPYLSNPSFTELQVIEQHAVARWNASLAFADNDVNFPEGAQYEWASDSPDAVWLSDPGAAAASARFPEIGAFTVTLTVYDASGNNRRVSMPLHVLDGEPPRWEPPENMSVAEGAGLVLNALDATDGGAILSILWVVDHLATYEGWTAVFTLAGLGVHTVETTFTDARGHSATYAFNVTVFDATRPRFVDPTFTREREVNQDDILWLDATAAFVDNDPTFPESGTFRWNVSGQGATFPGGATGPTVSLRFSSRGTHEVTLVVSDAYGNFVQVNVAVAVVDGRPPANLTWSVSPQGGVRPGDEFYMTVGATDETTLAYNWSFGDGLSAEGPTVVHAYAEPGVYHVVATVADERGNEANVSFDVTVVSSAGAAPTDLVVPALVVGALAAAVGGAWLVVRGSKRNRGPGDP